MSFQPRRVLLISATIGEGHNATARAVEEAARRVWPGCEVVWLDALRIMGRWVPRAFNWIYVTNVESTPWLYDFFYDALWRYRWFATASRRFVGAWCGPLLRREIRRLAPDLIVSTYPLGTAGLDWMRRRGGLDVPVSAVVSDFSPHPFWVYPEADLHYVMSEASLRAMRRAEPDAVGAVSVPPVRSRFQPRDRATARAEFGFPATGFTALVACGALSFGAVERAVDAALRAPGLARVLVVCGRNEAVRERLLARGDPRVVPLGWVDDMPGLMACSDAVITNAGGATALEALACGRAVVMFEPIAGHGRANAELMADAGLAELCPEEAQLTATLRRWVADPQEVGEREERALKHCRAAEFDEQVAALADLPRHRGRRPLRAQDAFFVYATTPEVSQQTGAILQLEPSLASTHQWSEHLAARIREHAPRLPMLTRRLTRRTGRRPQWIADASVDPVEHLSSRELRPEHDPEAFISEFFSTPVRTDRPPWELRLLHDPATGRATLLAKMHHALGDGLAVTGTLLRLLCDGPHPTPHSAAAGRTGQVREVLRGLIGLATSAGSPSRAWTGRSTPARSFGHLALPAVRVRAHARDHGVTSSALLIGLVAEALHRSLGEKRTGALFRVMVPRTARTGRSGAGLDAPGNHTRTLSVDLPVGPMPLVWRIRAVADALAEPDHSGQPEAAGAVLAGLGLLPAPLHAWVVRRIYGHRFFNAVVSVMPGRRRAAHINGSRLSRVLPVLSLADGVGVAIGAIGWGEEFGFGVTTDPGLAPEAHVLAGHLREAFDELRERR
ncbi:wax ester/triacylglycerol synthase family O-acyltransferase [Saccharopolyspora sp. TS4A08]|uniref:Wax ester/triacylglycerol synthase family O-acyltransferase n=1 Tax=Saccharopolyspora ipomoeae TaxID=3042027 RepID=A0ABT6PP12_9PSEU|nr:wax ester/triacylglycerol synthase domain-containing protein [Saccharopolyspora sp. TS4A08]MDI2029580.1 wax ester/triacylglycerol synthase family O-acyltransferase [Saccharopolyspora sp. TS4A08]